jgi:hypothetical protein
MKTLRYCEWKGIADRRGSRVVDRRICLARLFTLGEYGDNSRVLGIVRKWKVGTRLQRWCVEERKLGRSRAGALYQIRG